MPFLKIYFQLNYDNIVNWLYPNFFLKKVFLKINKFKNKTDATGDVYLSTDRQLLEFVVY